MRGAGAARHLLRDLALVRAHLGTLPLLFGSPRWHLAQKRRVRRPYTELWPPYYPVEYCRIACQTLLTLPFVLLVRRLRARGEARGRGVPCAGGGVLLDLVLTRVGCCPPAAI